MTRDLRGRHAAAAALGLAGLLAVAACATLAWSPGGPGSTVVLDWVTPPLAGGRAAAGGILLAIATLAAIGAGMQARNHPKAWAPALASGLSVAGWGAMAAVRASGPPWPLLSAVPWVGLAVGVGVAGVSLVQFRDWHLRWGTTDDESTRPMPGDDHVPRPHFHPTRAVTVEAPPQAVWPWLVQMGYGRAGFYSYDWLDNGGKPSLSSVDPALQALRVGEWIPMSKTISETTAFRVAALDPPRSMVWTKPDSSWAWELAELPGRRTRLVTRIRLRYERNLLLPLTLALMEVGDFWMMRRCLRGIKERAERAATRAGPAGTGDEGAS